MKKCIFSLFLAIGICTSPALHPMKQLTKSISKLAENKEFRALQEIATLMTIHESLVYAILMHPLFIEKEGKDSSSITHFLLTLYDQIEANSLDIDDSAKSFLDSLNLAIQKSSPHFTMETVFTFISMERELTKLFEDSMCFEYAAQLRAKIEQENIHDVTLYEKFFGIIKPLFDYFILERNLFFVSEPNNAIITKIIEANQKLKKIRIPTKSLLDPSIEFFKITIKETLTFTDTIIKIYTFYKHITSNVLTIYHKDAEALYRTYAQMYDRILDILPQKNSRILFGPNEDKLLPKHIFYLDTLKTKKFSEQRHIATEHIEKLIKPSKKLLEAEDFVNKKSIPLIKKLNLEKHLAIPIDIPTDDHKIDYILGLDNFRPSLTQRQLLALDLFNAQYKKLKDEYRNTIRDETITPIAKQADNCLLNDPLLYTILFKASLWNAGGLKFFDFTNHETQETTAVQGYPAQLLLSYYLKYFKTINSAEQLIGLSKNQKKKKRKNKIIIPDLPTSSSINTDIEKKIEHENSSIKIKNESTSQTKNTITRLETTSDMVTGLAPLFNQNKIKEAEKTNVVMIKQSWSPSPLDGFTLVIYKEKNKNNYQNLTIKQKEGTKDIFHKIPDCISGYLTYGIVYKKTMHEKPKILDTFACDFYFKKNDHFAIILPGKLINQKSYFNTGDPIKDKDIKKVGHHEGAFVFIFDDKNQCTHCCFHQTKDDKKLHDNYKKNLPEKLKK